MKPHSNSGADQLATHSPQILALVLCDSQVVGAEEQKLDELETVRPAFDVIALEGGAADGIVVLADLKRRVRKSLDEGMAGGQELDGNG